MTIDVLMPALSPTMTEGTLAKWNKKEGEAVKAGDVLAEIETDKATMEIEAVDEGVLGKILVPTGTQGVKVNQVIAVLLEEGESKTALGARPAPPTAKPSPAPSPPKPAPTTPSAAPAKAEPWRPSAPRAVLGDGTRRVVASPLAKRVAKEGGIDLAVLSGSGPGGRIVRADVDSAMGGGGASFRLAPSVPALMQRPEARGGMPAHTLVPHTNIRRVIARRLTEAKQNVPHFYLTIDCAIDGLLKARENLNQVLAAEGPAAPRLSVNDFIIRASALALKKVPGANAAWTEAGVALFHGVDISVAVAAPSGLITPIVRDADQKGLAAISTEMKDLVSRARDGKLKLDEFQGGTFTISNLGMYGIKQFEAVINPPQACILAIGAGEQRPVVQKGALAIVTMMSCTLSVDHRVVDGAIGAEFLAAFKKLIEDPLAMLL